MVSRITIAIAALWPFSPDRPPPAPAVGVEGVWSNPKGSVQVKTGACGDKLCGVVVYASPKAQADAKKAGAQPLIGTTLLRGYRANGTAQWAGQVYIPDRQASYYSTITMVDAQTLKVSGCILGGLICKSQLWHRVPSAGSMARVGINANARCEAIQAIAIRLDSCSRRNGIAQLPTQSATSPATWLAAWFSAGPTVV